MWLADYHLPAEISVVTSALYSTADASGLIKTTCYLHTSLLPVSTSKTHLTTFPHLSAS